MARIREYSRQVSAPGAIDAPRRSAQETNIGGGLVDVGQGLQQAGDTLQKIKQEKDAFESNKLVAQGNSYWSEQMVERQKTAQPGAPEFTQTFQKDFDEWKNEQLEKAPSTTTRRNMEIQFERMKNGLTEHATAFEARAYGQKQAQDLESQFGKDENFVRANPAMRDQTLAAGEHLINTTPFWDNQTKEKVRTEYKQKIWDRSLDGTVTQYENGNAFGPKASFDQKLRSVDAEIARLKSDKEGWQSNASPGQYDQSLTRLENLKKNLKDRQQDLVFLEFEDRMNQIEVTGQDHGKFTADWIRANVEDPVQAAKMIKRQETARAVGQQVAWVKDAPDTEIVSKIQSMQSGLGSSDKPGRDMGALNGAIQAASRRAQAWKEDQVGYTLQVSSTAKSVYDAFTANPTPEMASNYADTVKTEQKRLSPNSMPALLPETHVQQIAQTMRNIGQTEEGASQALTTLQSQQAIWGKNWPTVVRDLKNGKALNDVQYVAASMLDNPRATYLAQDLMRASVLKDEDLLKQISGDAVAKSAREKVVAALEPLRRTLDTMADGQEIYQSYEKALTRLVLYKGAWAGEDMSGEAEEYARKIVLDSYEFKDTYRIPKNQPVEPIENGVDKAMAQVEKEQLVMPADLDGLLDADAQERYKTNTLSFGRFVTNGDESGVHMVDEHGRPVQVLRKGQKVPLRYSWDDLKTLGAEIPTPETNPYKRFTD